jgi:hypothetical protein
MKLKMALCREPTRKIGRGGPGGGFTPLPANIQKSNPEDFENFDHSKTQKKIKKIK